MAVVTKERPLSDAGVHDLVTQWAEPLEAVGVVIEPIVHNDETIVQGCSTRPTNSKPMRSWSAPEVPVASPAARRRYCDQGTAPHIAAGSAAALFAFAAGVVVAIAHHDGQLRQNKRVRPDQLLVVEALLALSLPIMLIVFDAEFSNQAQAIHYVVIGIGAFAMGIQASALRRVGSIAVATTYGTGTVVRIGEKVALALRRAERTSAGRRSATIIVLVGVLASYVGGASAASALGSSPLLLRIPFAVLLTFAVAVRSSEGFRGAFAESRIRRSERRTTDY